MASQQVSTHKFGAFIDIGCHTQGLCHISRLSDGYVESVEKTVSVGDKVHARVVTVDLKDKKITLSLQSEVTLITIHRLYMVQ